MKIELVNGTFNPNEAMELISRLVDAKISFLQDKIETSSNEEDIKMRERRIRKIQSEFHETRALLMEAQKPCGIVATVKMDSV